MQGYENFDLSGKRALVTGASRGLGKGFALALAKTGCDVAVTSRSLESLDTRTQIASDASTNVTGQTLLVDGGISVGALKALPSQN